MMSVGRTHLTEKLQTFVMDKWTADMSVQNFVGDAMLALHGLVYIMAEALVGVKSQTVDSAWLLTVQLIPSDVCNPCCIGTSQMALLDELGLGTLVP